MNDSLNDIRPYRKINRRKSRKIFVGNVAIGGDAPISVQTMTNTKTTDIQATIKQIHECVEVGAELIRISVPDQESAIALKQIIAIDERNQFMTTASYLYIKWYDPRLKWNSTLSHNIDSISVLAKSIWLPDLFITNTADSNGFITVTDSNLAFIENSGYVKLTLSLIGKQKHFFF